MIRTEVAKMLQEFGTQRYETEREWNGRERMVRERENGVVERQLHEKERMVWERENGTRKREWY